MNDLARKAADAFMEEKGADKVTAALNTEFAGRLAEIYYKGVREAIDAFDLWYDVFGNSSTWYT